MPRGANEPGPLVLSAERQYRATWQVRLGRAWGAAEHACAVAHACLPAPQLVFSDEFEEEGRSFGVGAKDPRWTAENMWYEGTLDFENYRSDQARGNGRRGGAAWCRQPGVAETWFSLYQIDGRCHQSCHAWPSEHHQEASLQINTTGGAAVITMEKKPSWAYVQRFTGEVW